MSSSEVSMYPFRSKNLAAGTALVQDRIEADRLLAGHRDRRDCRQKTENSGEEGGWQISSICFALLAKTATDQSAQPRQVIRMSCRLARAAKVVNSYTCTTVNTYTCLHNLYNYDTHHMRNIYSVYVCIILIQYIQIRTNTYIYIYTYRLDTPKYTYYTRI